VSLLHRTRLSTKIVCAGHLVDSSLPFPVRDVFGYPHKLISGVRVRIPCCILSLLSCSTHLGPPLLAQPSHPFSGFSGRRWIISLLVTVLWRGTHHCSYGITGQLEEERMQVFVRFGLTCCIREQQDFRVYGERDLLFYLVSLLFIPL
jgi:hypothetical protein